MLPVPLGLQLPLLLLLLLPLLLVALLLRRQRPFAASLGNALVATETDAYALSVERLSSRSYSRS